MNDSSHFKIQPDKLALRPEWLRIPDATRVFGLSRSGLYELISAGLVKSFTLRKRGARKGVRLISYDSLAEFLEAESRKQAQKAVA